MGSLAKFTTTRDPKSTSAVPLVLAPCGARLVCVRALVISRVYADPAARGKLRALAGLGVTVAAAVPDRWVPAGLVRAAADQLGRRRRRPHRAGPDPRQRAAGGRIRSGTPAPCAACSPTFAPSSCRSRRSRGATAPPPSRGRRAGSGSPTWCSPARACPSAGARWPGSAAIARSPARRGSSAVNELAGRLGAAAATRPCPIAPSPRSGRRSRSPWTARAHTGLAIGFVGRLIPEKGLDLLFRAAVKLVGRWTITVVGTGPGAGRARGAGRAARHRRPGHLARRPAPRRGRRGLAPARRASSCPRARRRAGSRSRPAPRSTPWRTASRSSAAPPARCPRPSAMPAWSCPRKTSPRLSETLQRLHDDPAERPAARRAPAGGASWTRYTDAAVAERTLGLLARSPSRNRLTSPYLRAIFALHAHLGFA